MASVKANYVDQYWQNQVRAMYLARPVGARIVSVVSRDGGAAPELSDLCIRISRWWRRNGSRPMPRAGREWFWRLLVTDVGASK